MAKSIIIAENQTGSDILLNDLGGVVIPASGSVNLTGLSEEEISVVEIQSTNDLYNEVDNDNVLINDGVRTLTKQESLNVLSASASVQKVIKDNFLATSNPTSGDDENEGYQVGSRWINSNNGNSFYLSDASAGNARWRRVFSFNATFAFSFDQSTSSGDPGSGNFRFDNANLSLVTEIYVNTDTSDGLDIESSVLQRLSFGDQIFVKNDSNNSVSLLVVSGQPSDNSGWFTIPVSVQSSSGSVPSNGDDSGISIFWTGVASRSISRVQSIKSSNAQNINAGSVSITFNANTFSTPDITHVSGSANFVINTTGAYKVSFKIVGSNGTNRRSPRVSVFINGVEDLGSRSYDYSRNITDDSPCIVLPPYEIELTQGQTLTIRSVQSGSGGPSTTVLNECWVRIERTE